MEMFMVNKTHCCEFKCRALYIFLTKITHKQIALCMEIPSEWERRLGRPWTWRGVFQRGHTSPNRWKCSRWKDTLRSVPFVARVPPHASSWRRCPLGRRSAQPVVLGISSCCTVRVLEGRSFAATKMRIYAYHTQNAESWSMAEFLTAACGGFLLGKAWAAGQVT